MFNTITQDLEAHTGALIALQQDSKSDSTTDAQYKETLLSALTELAEALSKVQANTAQAQNARSEQNSELSNSLIKIMNDALNNVKTQIQKAEDAQEHQSFWDKLLNGLMTAIGAVLTCIGFPEIGLPMLAMGIMNLTGLSDKIADGISDLLQKMGIPKEVADFLGQLTLAVATIVLTMGTSTVSEGASFAMKCASYAAKFATTAGMTLTVANKLVGDAYLMCEMNDHSKTDEEKKEEAAKINEIAGYIGAGLALVGAFGEMACSSALKATESGLMNKIKSIGQKIAGKISENFKKFDKVVELFGSRTGQMLVKTTRSALQGANGATTAIYLNMQAGIQKELAKSEAEQQVAATTLSQIDSQLSNDLKFFSTRLKAQSQAVASMIGSIETEGQSFAQLLA